MSSPHSAAAGGVPLTGVAAATACDEGFAALMRSPLASLRHWHPEVPITLLDVGLAPATRAELVATFGVRVVEPEWHLDPAIVAHWSLEPWWRAMTARAYLPRYVDADLIFWIDADAWLAIPDALPQFVSAARQPDVAFVGVPQTDRNYRHQVGPSAINGMLALRASYMNFVDPDRALAHAVGQMITSGCFCAPAKSPIWSAWAAAMAELFDAATKENRAIAPLLEQLSLNEALDTLPAEQVQLLPARFNWLVGMAPPLIDKDTGRLLEPQPPHDPIAVVHLVHSGSSAEAKAKPLTTRTADGDSLTIPFTWEAMEPFVGMQQKP